MHLIIHRNVTGDEGFSVGPLEEACISSYVDFGISQGIFTDEDRCFDGCPRHYWIVAEIG